MATEKVINKKLILGIIIMAVIVGGLGTGGFMYIYSQTKAFDQVFMEGVSVENIPLGGLTKQEAKKKISEMLAKKDKDKTITLRGDGKELIIPIEKFAPQYNVDEVLDQAFKIGHEGNMIQRYQASNNKEKNTREFTLGHSSNKEIAQQMIKEYANEIYVAPQNATMVRENKAFIITPEKPGQELDIEATTERVNALYDSEGEGEVEAVIVAVPPQRTSSYFEQVQSPIASFYTSYDNSDSNRNKNLEIGAGTINTLVGPGEIFALSDYLEPITANNGYKSSKVILNGKLVDGIGGGICQVASTLYNSVLLTDLEIISRQNHSMPVGYIPLGRDATYASDIIDFKFKNPTEYPVYVESYCENNRLYVNIFGNENLKPENEIKFESVVVEVIPPPATVYKDDSSLPKGQKIQELGALSGKRVNLYKCTYDKAGKLINRELESKSYYRPRGAIVRVGTKESGPVGKPDPAQPNQGEEKPEDQKSPEVPKEPEVMDDSSQMDLYEEQI